MSKKKFASKVVAIAAVGIIALGASACDGKTTTTSASTDQATSEQAQTAQEAESTENLVVGTTVNLPDGLSVTVDSVETGLSNYDGSTVTGVHVTYVNNGKEGASYNPYDWKGQDANGAQQSTTFYSDASDELKSGTLAEGGSVSGNIYFDGDITSALYFENMFNDSSSASWTLA